MKNLKKYIAGVIASLALVLGIGGLVYASSMPKNQSSYWYHTHKVVTTRKVRVHRMALKTPAVLNHEIGSKVLKKGTKLSVENGGTVEPWILHGKNLNSTFHYVWVVNTPSTKWMKPYKKSVKKHVKKHHAKKHSVKKHVRR